MFSRIAVVIFGKQIEDGAKIEGRDLDITATAKNEFMYKTPQSYEERLLYLEAENAYLKELLGITAEKVKKKKSTK